ncbi:MAG: DUF5681 domain-containing protein [Bradyrhizobium sp.]
MIDERDAIEKTDDPTGKETTQSSDCQYKVGPGHPPLESQFKKGAPSPNPKGRPRKNASIAPDMKKLLEDGLKKKVKAKNGDTQVWLTRATLGIEQMLNQFAKGDRYARRDLMDIAKALGVDLLAGQKEKIEEALSPSHQVILDSFISRHPQVKAAAPPPRVIAPPELLDGIVPKVLSPEKVTRPLNRPPPK